MFKIASNRCTNPYVSIWEKRSFIEYGFGILGRPSYPRKPYRLQFLGILNPIGSTSWFISEKDNGA